MNHLPPPPEFEKAPAWAIAWWNQARQDHHALADELMAQQLDIRDLKREIGKLPDSDGKGGTGLLGDMAILKALRAKGMGFIAAIGLTGALIVAGIVEWLRTALKH